MELGVEPPVIVAIPPSDEPAALRAPDSEETFRILAGETMGTTWSARFFAPTRYHDSQYRRAIEAKLQKIVTQMSHWLADSELCRFNRASSGCWQSLQPAFFHVLDFSLRVAEESGGAYDPTVGPIVDEWGFGPAQKQRRPPDSQTLAAVRQQCGWTRVELDRGSRQARHHGNLGLDFSSVAKGFAVDRIGHALKSFGIRSYLVEIGGEFRASGLKFGDEPWWVGIEPPEETASSSLFPEIRVALSGWSIATSGGYRNYFEFGDKQWTHTIDPRTGNAIGQDLASVSVIHKQCMAADAYSTALMVLGADHGLAFAERMGLAAIFLIRGQENFEFRCTEGFRRMTESAG